jgi:predicted lipoprotein with Yx(FWY)xxD motif
MMWRAARWSVGLLALSIAVSGGVAFAQYSAPSQAPAAQPAAPAPAAGAPVSLPYTLNARWVSVHGAPRMILTDQNGMTLYYLTSERESATRCLLRCADIWPPALANGFGMFTVDPALQGQVTVVKRPSGMQLAYNGHLLYRFAKDTAPGQVNGDGVYSREGLWVTAAPGIAFQPAPYGL